MRQHFSSAAPEKLPTKQALSKARHKIRPSAFSTLNSIALDLFYQDSNKPERIMGLRALAVDGTDLRLESRAYEEMLDVYSKNGEHLPLSVRDPQSPNIRASALYDIENNIVVDLQFGPKIFSEEGTSVKTYRSYEHR